MMTAHDYPSAIFVENSGMEVCLVGDSLGMVALGYDSTTQVTMQVIRVFIFTFPLPERLFQLTGLSNS